MDYIDFNKVKFIKKVRVIAIILDEWINSDKKTKMCIDKYFASFAYFAVRY